MDAFDGADHETLDAVVVDVGADPLFAPVRDEVFFEDNQGCEKCCLLVEVFRIVDGQIRI